MTIGELINHYAQPYSPYMGNLVNHLPMGQMALYRMDRSLEDIQSYSEYFIERSNINLLQSNYPASTSIEECLGRRELYEPCLDIIKARMEEEGIEKILREVLNAYPYGLSSGIFHTIIRVYFAVEGFMIDEKLDEEVARALAYYVTGYKEAKIFKRPIKATELNKEIKGLINNPHVKQLIHRETSRGKKMKALYQDERYIDYGFIIRGDEEKKIRRLLEFILPLYDHYQDIIILHCITGLQALIGLKGYFNDFEEALDIMTTCIITHLLTINGLELQKWKNTTTDKNWDDIIEKGTNSLDVHTIKYTYSCRQLDRLYGIPSLKASALNKINKEQHK